MSFTFSQYFLYLQYLFAALLMMGIFGALYTRITPPRELELIKSGNLACALSFGGALIGFCAALVSAMTHSIGLVNFVVWGVLAGVVQIGLFFVSTRIIPDAISELEHNNVAVGAFLCAISIAIGLLNAACLVD
ncbi:DUF350 domain-containing protein [Kingella kingae]|uniref:DUF350 domain-containing protein n=1 Tax=Kingella kingae TaxID=504 RepID=UPI00057179A1|nr:DUF350 domain-containing protein [Kingella kingae]MDK4624313.1 DUF350 domain-containing protein [Kingella kingae]MDK4659954.1 DUF350 domain-containing protein [Kingella kingae]MDK4667880.1 DUF350 domain-containing protein [Kingella kingae]MDK4686243.1 DUF350 domain-containing protein [Kingella kingae]